MTAGMAQMWVLLATSILILPACSKSDRNQDAVAPASTAVVSQAPGPDGEALFRQYCSSCHPNGGNVSDPERTLHGSVLRKKHITTPEDIVRIMRKPVSRMIRFDAATLSDRDARAIAEYVLKTFK